MEEKKQKRMPALPWMRSPVDISQFDQWPLSRVPCLDPELKKALESMDIESLFPVQVAVWLETIGPGAFERDLCVNSPTGSGKTLAYALPIVQTLSKCTLNCLRALVVLPTRDLALQVKEVFASIAPAVGLRVGLAVGQSSVAEEISELIRRPTFEFGIYDPEGPHLEPETSVDILVATPGRLMDHINTTRGFTLEHLRYLVVDETDRLLREAYQSWLPTVLDSSSCDQGILACQRRICLPSIGSLKTIRRFGIERGFKGKTYPRLVKMIFSATVTQDPSKLSQLNLHHPLFLTTGARRYQLPENLESYQLICESKLKPLYLAALLQNLGGDKCIVFTSSVESTHRLSTLLNSFDDLPFKIAEYSGLQRQSVRSKTLRAFRIGKIQVLVASDAMTRGMDVEGVRNVINYDMPPYIKTYIHRVGRTARAGRSGRCFTILRKHEVKRFNKLLQKADGKDCNTYSILADSVDALRPTYYSALEKLKERMGSEASRRHSARSKSLKYEKSKGETGNGNSYLVTEQKVFDADIEAIQLSRT